jgi:hypothetical protein
LDSKCVWDKFHLRKHCFPYLNSSTSLYYILINFIFTYRGAGGGGGGRERKRVGLGEGEGERGRGWGEWKVEE